MVIQHPDWSWPIGRALVLWRTKPSQRGLGAIRLAVASARFFLLFRAVPIVDSGLE